MIGYVKGVDGQNKEVRRFQEVAQTRIVVHDARDQSHGEK
jgi:hypothetical protein